MKTRIVTALTIGTLLLLVGSAYAVSPVVVTVEPGVCEETTITAQTDPSITNNNVLYLVVDTENDTEQYAPIPTDGSGISISVGPFSEDTTVSWHVFGGGERDWDQPLWNGYGTPTFKIDIANYADSVGGSYSWVVSGTDDPNPFVTWNTFEVLGCILKPVAMLHGGGHLLEDTGSKRKDWYDVSFGGWITKWSTGFLEGDFQVNLHNVGDDSLDKSKFHGTDVVDLNLYKGDSPTCNDAVNFTINGTLNGEPGYSMIFRAGDNGTPNIMDTARVTIYNGENASGGIVYDTHTIGEFTDESTCVGTARTGLDTGNFTIWQE